MADSDTGPITKFPADDLRPAKRFITSHNTSGQGIFVGDDNGDHHRVMVRGKGVANIIYSTISNPVDLNNEADIAYAREHEVNSPVLDASPPRIITGKKNYWRANNIAHAARNPRPPRVRDPPY